MYVAIDVGGTKIRITAYTELDPNTQTIEMKHDTTGDFDQDFQNILQTLSSLEDIQAIGIAIPGISINKDTGIVLAHNLPDWNNKNIKTALSSVILQDKIFISHDAVANALGEMLFSKTGKAFVYITWGTGVGAAYITKYDSMLVTQQIEFGRQLVNGVPLENLVGGVNFPKNFNNKTGSELDNEDWKVLTENFSTGLANLYALNYSPQIIWGGGVAVKQFNRIPPIMEMAAKKYPYGNKIRYGVSSFGEWGGVVGALANIKYCLQSSQTHQ